MQHVNVLLSTYNGKRYMRELIDSIIAQEGVSADILARDDGSTDGYTQRILDDYQQRGLLTWYQGENLRPAHSFMQLLADAHEAPFYAFADEDDYWQPDKLATAVKALEPYTGQPALYFSRTQLTDENLNPIPGPVINPLLTFGESLVYKFIPGCTMVFNKELRDIVNTFRADFVPMHDIWIYSIALAVKAKVVFDPQPHILYRQHGDNTIGQGQGQMHEWHRRLKRLNSHERYRQACELLRGYAPFMGSDELETLSTFVNARRSLTARLRLIGDKRFVCADSRTYRLFQLAVLLNIY